MSVSLTLLKKRITYVVLQCYKSIKPQSLNCKTVPKETWNIVKRQYTCPYREQDTVKNRSQQQLR